MAHLGEPSGRGRPPLPTALSGILGGQRWPRPQPPLSTALSSRRSLKPGCDLLATIHLSPAGYAARSHWGLQAGSWVTLPLSAGPGHRQVGGCYPQLSAATAGMLGPQPCQPQVTPFWAGREAHGCS